MCMLAQVPFYAVLGSVTSSTAVHHTKLSRSLPSLSSPWLSTCTEYAADRPNTIDVNYSIVHMHVSIGL